MLEKGFHQKLREIKEKYNKYLCKLFVGNHKFKLTSNSEPSPYARCFAIYGFHLIGKNQFLKDNKDALINGIIKDLKNFKEERSRAGKSLNEDKPFLQLLTFSLSALSVLGVSDRGYLNDNIMTNEFRHSFDRLGVLSGKPRSGNHAMFVAIMMCHAQDYMSLDCNAQLSLWVQLLMGKMN